jgi:hypothetical protein
MRRAAYKTAGTNCTEGGGGRVKNANGLLLLLQIANFRFLSSLFSQRQMMN